MTQTTCLQNFKNGDWQMIDSMPSNEMDSLKKEYKDEYHVADQLGTYYMGWNINKRILPEDSTLTGVEAEKAQAEIRQAIGLMIDRNYIVNEIGKADQIPASSFVAKALRILMERASLHTPERARTTKATTMHLQRQ